MLTPVKNRAAGSVVALAVGNALGAPFEFEPPMKDHEVFKAMSSPGKNGYAVGEWTSDTVRLILPREILLRFCRLSRFPHCKQLQVAPLLRT
jgi:ADP-ribosyl-[dinitrogen reductase] hydrolase